MAAVAEELEAELVLVGLPLTLGGDEGHQADAARMFAGRLSARLSVPVEMYDERLTTRMADATGGAAQSDSVAAAHLLESYLTMRGHGEGRA